MEGKDRNTSALYITTTWYIEVFWELVAVGKLEPPVCVHDSLNFPQPEHRQWMPSLLLSTDLVSSELALTDLANVRSTHNPKLPLTMV